MADDALDGLLAEQIAYYRARAGEYDATYPVDAAARAQLLTALEAHAPFGRTLELACGTGQWTGELARHASALTAVDAAPEALAICRRRPGTDRVDFVEADLFEWRPPERYDFVFFSGWLSHVPPQRFDAFWALVADCLAPGGRVFVIDELPAVADVERAAPGEPAPSVRREVSGGQAFRAVKVLYAPDELRAHLAALDWQADVATVGWRFFFATLRRADGSLAVRLRPVEDGDLDAFFEHQADPVAAAMAVMPVRERDQFDAHWAKIRADDDVIQRTILAGGVVAGGISSWHDGERRLVGYQLGREQWGRGVATRALQQFVDEVPERPLYAHVATSNAGSIRVLQKCGFRRDLAEEAQAPEPEDGVEELIFVLAE
ncbi:GNAT family N-acetyltransferase [Actinoplanes sp. CA-142083]|uniref:GNAT family N-acetyltransferase n=1 Tax=Actinoplanes sp. CA-142083 TaxID=3239903 RepID=UPI003D89F567